MKHLMAFVEQENAMAVIFKHPVIDLAALTQETAQDLFDNLCCKLSPENISCDGEMPQAHVRRLSKLYHGAIKDLLNMGFELNGDPRRF